MIQPLNVWIIAALLALTICIIAMRLRMLAPSGAIAAIATGTIIVGTGGWWPGIILVTFFATSSAISLIKPGSTSTQVRGSRRDWVQVLANGWGTLLGCVLYGFTGWSPWLLFAVGAIAAATADTWSSEIGRTSTTPPRLITTMKVVPAGTSGAVSPRGLVASVTGATLIAFLALLGSRFGLDINAMSPYQIAIGLLVAGIAGGSMDSLLGATVQEQRWCDTCARKTEHNPHSCGTVTRHIGGIEHFNNDVVNILCVMTGALVGLLSGMI